MSPRPLVPLAVVALCAAQVAAAQSQPPNPPTVPDSAVAASPVVSGKPADAARVLIDFQNHSWELATIYAVHESGARTRIGEVGAGKSATLVVPRTVVSSVTAINLVAIPIGRRSGAESGVLAVAPGDHFVATLESNLKSVSILPIP